MEVGWLAVLFPEKRGVPPKAARCAPPQAPLGRWQRPSAEKNHRRAGRSSSRKTAGLATAQKSPVNAAQTSCERSNPGAQEMTDMTGAASWSISRRLRGEEYRRPRIWRATTPVKEAAEMGARLDPRYGLQAALPRLKVRKRMIQWKPEREGAVVSEPGYG